VIKTVKQACRFNAVIHDYRMSQGIESLAELILDEGDGGEFFSRNYVTHGMAQLFREGLLRLSGKSDQAVFELTQAMGGGKTHMMIALGLLARHSHLRPGVLPADVQTRVEFGQARIAAFNGRNTLRTTSGATLPRSSARPRPSSRSGPTDQRPSTRTSGRKSSATSQR
jgi:hypothetical protein